MGAFAELLKIVLILVFEEVRRGRMTLEQVEDLYNVERTTFLESDPDTIPDV